MAKARLGPVPLRVLPILNVVAWIAFPPGNDGRADFSRQILAEVLSSTAVVLLAIALVLSTRARWIEPYFGGLDKMYRSHRDAATAGFILLVLHVALIPWRLDSQGGVPAGLIAFVGLAVLIALSLGPRLAITRRFLNQGYRSWRLTHRFIGFFFIFSLAHMLLVDSLVVATVIPFALVMVAFVIGIVSYLYAFALARFVRPTRRYRVEESNRLNDRTLEVVLSPLKAPLVFGSGQFVFVRFKGRRFREPHPFTVASSPTEEELRVVIKASGDFTRHLYDNLEPGRKAVVEGAYGMLDYRHGRPEQIWIAGGIGVTPFLSWLRDIEAVDHQIDFFYTVRHPDEALFTDDIVRVADHDPNIRFHMTISARDGSLTMDRIASLTRGAIAEKSVYMCGPVGMVKSYEKELGDLGVASDSIHYEEFSFR